MNTQQKAATERLRKTLDKCHAVGLRGGVYEGSFYLWPTAAKPDPRDCGRYFFEGRTSHDRR